MFHIVRGLHEHAHQHQQKMITPYQYGQYYELSSIVKTVLPTPAPPITPILRPLTKGVKKSITFIPVSRISGLVTLKLVLLVPSFKIFLPGRSWLVQPADHLAVRLMHQKYCQWSASPTGISIPLPVRSTAMAF